MSVALSWVIFGGLTIALLYATYLGLKGGQQR